SARRCNPSNSKPLSSMPVDLPRRAGFPEILGPRRPANRRGGDFDRQAMIACGQRARAASAEFIAHTSGRQGTAALRNFNAVYVSLGSFTTEAGEATCPCTSALPRKQTKCRSSQQVRFVPKADSCIAANCAIGCLATLGTSSLSLGGQQPLGRLQKRCPVPARS